MLIEEILKDLKVTNKVELHNSKKTVSCTISISEADNKAKFVVNSPLFDTNLVTFESNFENIDQGIIKVVLDFFTLSEDDLYEIYLESTQSAS